jgi:hypothetical protein
MGLVRTASGQVFKVCANQVTAAANAVNRDISDQTVPVVANEEEEGAAVGEAESLDAEDSLAATAEVNHWRCSGFPLYGQVLILYALPVSLLRPVTKSIRHVSFFLLKE